jgi:hypothetical protein
VSDFPVETEAEPDRQPELEQVGAAPALKEPSPCALRVMADASAQTLISSDFLESLFLVHNDTEIPTAAPSAANKVLEVIIS